jgi:hypothetical protein
MKEARAIGLLVGAIVLIALAISCGAGYAASRGGAGVVAGVRDVGIIILAILSLIMALLWGAIYFVLAWVLARFGPKGITGLRWVGGKAALVEQKVGHGSEEYIVRPLARTVRRLTTASTLGTQLIGGPVRERGGLLAAARRSFWHRLHGRTATPGPTTTD